MTLAKKKVQRCAATTKTGTPCRSYAVSKEGVAKLLDAGTDLVADPTMYCSFHARTETARFAFQSKGGTWSPIKAREEEPPPEKAMMPKEIAAQAHALVVELLDAKLPGTLPPETDARKAALGAYLAAHLYTVSDDHAKLLWQLLPRDVHGRDDLEELAEHELRLAIEDLAPDERTRAWEIVAAA